jgi:hypothetical protein
MVFLIEKIILNELGLLLLLLFLLSWLDLIIDYAISEINFIFETVFWMGSHDTLLHLLWDIAFVFLLIEIDYI